MKSTTNSDTQLPGHEQAAAFWVGAFIATQAIAVYIEPDRSGGPFDGPQDFDRLPPRLKIRVLEACEEEFRRRREILLGKRRGAGDWTVSELTEQTARDNHTGGNHHTRSNQELKMDADEFQRLLERLYREQPNAFRKLSSIMRLPEAERLEALQQLVRH